MFDSFTDQHSFISYPLTADGKLTGWCCVCNECVTEICHWEIYATAVFHWLRVGVILSRGEIGLHTFLKGATAAERICDLTPQVLVDENVREFKAKSQMFRQRRA